MLKFRDLSLAFKMGLLVLMSFSATLIIVIMVYDYSNKISDIIGFKDRIFDSAKQVQNLRISEKSYLQFYKAEHKAALQNQAAQALSNLDMLIKNVPSPAWESTLTRIRADVASFLESFNRIVANNEKSEQITLKMQATLDAADKAIDDVISKVNYTRYELMTMGKPFPDNMSEMLRIAGDCKLFMLRSQILQQAFMLTGDPAHIERFEKYFSGKDARSLLAFEQMAAILKNDDFVKAAKAVKTEAQNFKALAKQTQDMRLEEKSLTATLDEIGNRVIASSEGLLSEANQAVEATKKEAGKTITATVLVSMLVCLLVAAILIRMITNPLRKGLEFAAAVGRGDLDRTLDVCQGDEAGKMCAALQAVSHSLKEVIAEYNVIVHAVESGELMRRGDQAKFQGGFAGLIQGANRIADTFTGHLDSLPIPVLTIGVDNAILYCNAAGCSMNAIAEMGRRCMDVFSSSNGVKNRFTCNLSSCTILQEDEVSSMESRSENIDIVFTCSPIRDQKGVMRSALEIAIDQTSIKSAQRKMLHLAQEAMEIAGRVASVSEDLSEKVEQVSRGAELQAQRVGETATAMEQMNVTVMEVAKNAAQVSGSAENARTQAHDGEGIVSRAVAAIDEVRQRAAELKTNMSDLGGKAENVGHVMNMISDIADQTNLLALNAAIEAARAGDAGRGFAVVADEVRKLAEKTMTATKEVEGAILGIQDGTRSNIQRVEVAVTTIGKATELAKESGESLKRIVELVGVVSDQVHSIATAAEEQSATSEEINRAVEEVDRISGETSAAMRQSVDAIAELADQARLLDALIHKLQGDEKHALGTGGRAALPR